MGVLDRFEKGVERAVNGAFSRVGSQDIKPVDLATALRREVDDRVIVVSRDRSVAPNRLHLELSTPDFDKVDSWGPEALANELATNVTEYAQSQGYAFVGPVSVIFEENIDLPAGELRVSSESVPGRLAPADPQAEEPPTPTRSRPILDINGQRYVLGGPLTIIGRGSDCDIVVDDPGVSRHHLEIQVGPQGTVATDMGSTNGLFVEGHQVPAAPLLAGNTLTLGRTRLLFWEGADDRR